METKACQNCKQNFNIEQDDKSYYEKIKVPSPTWCPKCRAERRLSFVNVWSIFWRNCDKCGKKTMSAYPQDQNITVYCQSCWWGDSWDGTEYAMDYDSSRPFLEQVKELADKTPYVALETLYTSLKNSDYSNGMAWCKDAYQVFWADYCEFVYYSSLLNTVKQSSDLLRANGSELCYGSVGLNKCYNTYFCEECDTCVDVWFLRNCYNCTNCVGCVNMRGASHCIFNEKYSKEEYDKKIKELALNTTSGQKAFAKQAEEFFKSKPRREYTGNSLNVKVTGEYVYESKNSKEAYMCTGVEDSKWCQFVSVAPAKDCVDYSGWGNSATLIYESANVGENANSSKFSIYCFPDSFNVEYCMWNIAGKNNLGCVNLKRKKYCILNKEYSKEEFESLKEKIIEDMKQNPYVDKMGRKYGYGEFFPFEFSKFSYNTGNGFRFYPKTKEQALAEGYYWYDKEEQTREATMQANALPETIKETDDSILNETIACSSCVKAYRIVKGELDLLRKMDIPAPRECPKCRENERFSKINPPKLYDRHCAKCKAPIVTAFSPEKPDIVYCVKCYQQELA